MEYLEIHNFGSAYSKRRRRSQKKNNGHKSHS
jgi:hypothetical protein